MIAALYVDPKGPYFGRADVDPWDESRDARLYPGPHPVVAHPPCNRWGRFWWRGVLGADGGCFESALKSVETWGGVLEHPEGSLAWPRFGLETPTRGRWTRGLFSKGWTCSVDQGNYGHRARKRTWLYFVGKKEPPPLDWRDAPGDVLVAANARSRRLGLEVMTNDLERRLTPPYSSRCFFNSPESPVRPDRVRPPRRGVEVMTHAERRLTPPPIR